MIVSDKRQRIIEAARNLFSQRRFDDVSVPEIVRLAGVAQGTFYRYFHSKNSLIDALGQELNDSVATAIHNVMMLDQPLVAQLETILHVALNSSRAYQDILGFLKTDALLFSETPQGQSQRIPVLTLLTKKLEQDQTRGFLRQGADLRVLVRLLDSTLNRVAYDCLIGQTGIPTETYVRETVLFLRAAIQ